MPIDGISDIKRAPRLGKIRLGIKAPNKDGKGEHPVAVDYFVIPESLKAFIPDEKPRILEVMFLIEDEEVFAQQWYRKYSLTRGLICRGDGRSCFRTIDTATGAFPEKDTKKTKKVDGACQGRECPEYQMGNCREVMNLQFSLPNVPGLGIWQIDTGSINSIININSAIKFIKQVYRRISFIPLLLSIQPQEVISPADGKKKTVSVLQLNSKFSMAQLAAARSKNLANFLLPSPDTEEPPDDIENDLLPNDVPLTPFHKGRVREVETTAREIPDTDDDMPDPVLEDDPAEEDIQFNDPSVEKSTAKVYREAVEGKPAEASEKQHREELIKKADDLLAGEKPASEPQPDLFAEKEAPPKAEPPKMITKQQLERLKYLKTNFTVALAPYVRKLGRDIPAYDQLTFDEALQVISEVEIFLQSEGRLPNKR